MDVAEAQVEDVDAAAQAARKVSGRQPRDWLCAPICLGCTPAQTWGLHSLTAPHLPPLPHCMMALHSQTPHGPSTPKHPWQAFDEGPWPRMTGEQRGRVLYRLADLIEVRTARGVGHCGCWSGRR